MFIEEALTAIGIFPVFFPACCLLRFAAFFNPWITKDTREMMIERDRLKSKAKDLPCRDLELGIEPSEEQKLAWNEFKKI